MEILTRQDVSKFFKLPIRTVDYLVQTDQIPFSRLGKRGVRFSRSRLEKWFQDREGIEFRHSKSHGGNNGR